MFYELDIALKLTSNPILELRSILRVKESMHLLYDYILVLCDTHASYMRLLVPYYTYDICRWYTKIKGSCSINYDEKEWLAQAN